MKTSKSVILPAYNDNLLRAILGLKVEEKQIRELQASEVLVRMAASPCNPSDIAFLRGGYNIIKPLPAIPGFEASGTIVETGTDVPRLLSKKVSCFIQGDFDGTWSDFFIARAKDCIVLKDNMDIKQAACLSINPLTAYGMFEMIKEKNCNTFIQNAAGGQVPGFMRILAKKHGINVINIVRKEEHLDKLLAEGNQFVLNTGSESFETNLQELCKDLTPTLAFDAVGGNITGQMLNAMPENSQVVVYGGLSGEKVSMVDVMGIIFNKKSISGFNLNDWIPTLSKERFVKMTDEIQDMFISGEFFTTIQAEFPLDDVVKGLRTYIKSMSSGKVLFVP
ncbi:MAG: zinc-binding dehydrogenase [Bacteroidales bacterium]